VVAALRGVATDATREADATAGHVRAGRYPGPIVRRFADTAELTPADARGAPLRSMPRPSRLAEPLALKGKPAQAAAALGIETVGDLLEHIPRDHLDRRDASEVAALAPEQEATVSVVVNSVKVRPMRNRRQKAVEARVTDGTGPLLAVWFNRPWVARQIAPGMQLLLRGRLKRGQRFWVDEHDVVGDGAAPIHTFGLVPVYPATQGLPPERLRRLTWDAYERVRDVVEPLPGRLRAGERVADRPAALAAVHFPDADDDATESRRRLAFEELLLFELSIAGRRRARREGARAAPLTPTDGLVGPWLDSLPFELTADQRAANVAIDRDLASEAPMQRLLMGEVGAGKTVIALHAMLRAVEGGGQAAMMAPTETLAEQHLATIDRLLGGRVPVALLTGSTPGGRRREILARLESGELGLVVGTHALIEPDVEFRALAVCVVDEQHRFGVRQRAALDAKAPDGLAPHVLHLTATPIPRTLALTAYGDLDVTALRELPAGRPPVETHVVDGARARARAYQRIREEIAAGRQCFVVYPLVEESEALQARAATAEYERLSSTEFREQRVALIHGQMPAKDKQAAMRAFASGEADVLVATSVIEVGIDVPNASVMLVEHAERYGISQLHQLRGRVGRGEHPSLCILFGDPANPRLHALATERDGFKLAEVDLALRGAGDVLGTRQHGLPQFRVARIPEDAPLLERARERADQLLDADARLEQAEHSLLRDAAVARFGPELDPIPA
jgi:ATP-dependent DNA helicase RecG